MAVSRHRRAHVVAPAKVLAEAASKARDAIDQRAQIMAAAEAGDPSAFVALANIVADLRKVHERLERTADGAEQDSQRSPSPHCQPSSSVRAKIGGVGGYAPQKALVPGEGTAFAVNLHFSGGQSERVAFHVSNPAPAPTIEAEAEPGEGDAVSEPAPPSAKLARLAKAFGAKAAR